MGGPSVGSPVLSLAMMSLGTPPPPPPLSSASQTANGVVDTHVERGHSADSCSAAPSPAGSNRGVTGGEAAAGTAANPSGLSAASALAGLCATTSLPSTLPLPPLPSTLPGSGSEQLSPSTTATHPSNAASNLSATGRAISFLLVAEEEATRAPARVRRIVNATSLDAVQAELRLSLGLPADSQLMYFSTEFEEWVAIEDLVSLPDKCRVRAVPTYPATSSSDTSAALPAGVSASAPSSAESTQQSNGRGCA